MTIKEKRNEKKWTQEELAEMMGVSVSTIAAWEAMQYMPSATKFAKLAKLFKCSIEELMEEFKKKKATSMQLDFSNNGNKTISEAVKEIINVMVNKKLTYGDALTALAECKRLIKGRPLG